MNAVSMGASHNSDVTILQSLSIVSYQFVWSGGGTPVGTISVQTNSGYTLAPDGQTVLVAGTWSTLTLFYGGAAVTSIPISGNSGDLFCELETASYALRLVYTRASGTGEKLKTLRTP